MVIQEYLDELVDISSRNDYLKFELYNALQDGDTIMAIRYYNMVNEAEELIVRLTEIIEDFSSLN